MSARKNNKKHLSRQRIYRWHSRVGLLSALIIIIVSVTGVVLNHNAAFKLDQTLIDQEWILTHYGLSPKGEFITYPAGNHYVSVLDGSLYFNDQHTEQALTLVGAVRQKNLIAAVSTDTLYLLTDNGELIEKLSGPSLPPGNIERIGTSPEQQTILSTEQGLFASDSDFLEWKQYSDDNTILWAEPKPLATGLRQEILKHYRGKGLSLYRILLDIHTGRFFGSWGPFIFDLAALGLLLLAATGIYNWYLVKKR